MEQSATSCISPSSFPSISVHLCQAVTHHHIPACRAPAPPASELECGFTHDKETRLEGHFDTRCLSLPVPTNLQTSSFPVFHNFQCSICSRLLQFTGFSTVRFSFLSNALQCLVILNIWFCFLYCVLQFLVFPTSLSSLVFSGSQYPGSSIFQYSILSNVLQCLVFSNFRIFHISSVAYFRN